LLFLGHDSTPIQFWGGRTLAKKQEERSCLMSVQIALLRAVNVGGHQALKMAKLRDLLTELGLIEVRSLLQTGNLVFRTKTTKTAGLESLLEKEAAKRLDLSADIFVRTAVEWKQIIARNPFRDEAKHDPAHLVVTFLKRAPQEKAIEALRTSITGPEFISVDGRHVYIVYPAGIGRSRLTNALVEKKLGTRGTARNWNTVLKLAAAAEE
jgi:uncharacterized protein (DUF1697 family)